MGNRPHPGEEDVMRSAERALITTFVLHSISQRVRLIFEFRFEYIARPGDPLFTNTNLAVSIG